MAGLTFDTLKFANKLKAAGVPPEQAEAEAVVLSEVLEVNLKDLATKEDLKSGLKELEIKLDSRFEKLLGEITLLKWMLGIVPYRMLPKPPLPDTPFSSVRTAFGAAFSLR